MSSSRTTEVRRERRPDAGATPDETERAERAERAEGVEATGAGSPVTTDEDVLDRLARLGEPPAAPVVDEPIDLPVIVEADPTVPPVRPVTVPAALREPVDTVLGVGATIPGSLAASTTIDIAVADVAPVAPVADGAPTGSAAAASGVVVDGDAPASTVSADLPTAAVGVPPDGAALDGAVLDGAVLDGAVLDGAVVVPTIDRTDAVPFVVPDVVPQLVPAPGPIPMTPTDGVAVDESTGMTLPVRRLRPPLVFRRAKPRVRRVTRVVRHVDTWSVFKVALVFNVILYLVCLTAGVLLWNVAHATGTIDNVERFFEQFGWETFEFRGGEIYHNAWIGGLFVVIGLTGFAVLLATLFNLITDLVGGIRVSVLEEEVIATPRRPGDPTGSTASTGIPRP